MPGDAYLSGLWNGIEIIVSFWAQELEAALEANESPPEAFWARLGQDLEVTTSLVYRAAAVTREGDAKPSE